MPKGDHDSHLKLIATKQTLKEQWFTLTGGTSDIYESSSIFI